MSHPLPDPLPIGSLALTLKRTDPRNAGLVVEILAHVGAAPEWRIEDGYRVRRIDGQPIPSSITPSACRAQVPNHYVDRHQPLR